MGNRVSFMRIVSVVIFCLIFCFVGFPVVGFSADIVTGVIIEQSADKNFIQVRDSIYKVANVWRDNGTDDPVFITRYDLKVGSRVQIYPQKKNIDYWQTEKIVLLPH